MCTNDMYLEATVQPEDADVEVEALLSSPPPAEPKVPPPVRRRRRERRPSARYVSMWWLGVPTALIFAAISLSLSPAPSSAPRPQPHQDGREPSTDSTMVGGQKLILRGGSQEARAQGFRDCTGSQDQSGSIICYRHSAMLFGLAAVEAELVLRGAGAGSDDFDPSTMKYGYVRFRFGNFDQSSRRIKEALRQSGWSSFLGPGEGTYYHHDLGVSLTLWRDYTNDQLFVVAAPENIVLANSRVAIVQEKLAQSAAAAARLQEFISDMRRQKGDVSAIRPQH